MASKYYNAFSGFTTCNLWKKIASKYYSSLLRLYYLQSLEKMASKYYSSLPAISGKKWVISSAVAFSGFTTCNLWKENGQ